MEKRRVVITGLGAVTPIGNTAADSWAAAKAGKCGIAPITRFDTEGFKVKLAAEVKDLVVEDHLDKREAKKMARFTQLALIAAAEAFADSGLNMANEDADQCGVILSSGIGGLDVIESETRKALTKGFDRISPFFIPMVIPNMAAGRAAIQFGLKGLCSCVVTACAGGSNAVGDAFRHIRDGYAEVMVCGGADSTIAGMGVGGFTSLRAVTTTDDPSRASIPFDQERGGFVMGEGAGILVLEEREHALHRGAKILAEIVGYGANCDAYHITSPNPEGEGGADCMRLAIADAGIQPEEISYINAHGTSTHLNDACETKAIKAVFGAKAYEIPVSSTKSMTGHLLGAAGGVEALFSVKALEEQFIPATINYQVPDPECDLDIVPNEGRAAKLDYVLSNSLGFGGHNACLIFKKA